MLGGWLKKGGGKFILIKGNFPELNLKKFQRYQRR